MALHAIRRLFGIGRTSRVATPEAIKIFERDNYQCRYCGLDGRTSFENWLILTVDFVHPRAHGGAKHGENLVTACQPCNTIKGLHSFKSFEDARAYVLKRRAEWKSTYESQAAGKVHTTAA